MVLHQLYPAENKLVDDFSYRSHNDDESEGNQKRDDDGIWGDDPFELD